MARQASINLRIHKMYHRPPHKAAPPAGAHRGIRRLRTKELEQPLDRGRADAPRLRQRRAQRVVRRRRRRRGTAAAPPRTQICSRRASPSPCRSAARPARRRTPRAGSASRRAFPARRAPSPRTWRPSRLEPIMSRGFGPARPRSRGGPPPTAARLPQRVARPSSRPGPAPQIQRAATQGVLQPTRRLGVALDTGGARDLAVARDSCRRAAPRTFRGRRPGVARPFDRGRDLRNHVAGAFY